MLQQKSHHRRWECQQSPIDEGILMPGSGSPEKIAKLGTKPA
jgi:hypothetical protein